MSGNASDRLSFGPWNRAQLLAALCIEAAAVVVLGWAVLRTRDIAVFAHQMRWVSIGIFALMAGAAVDAALLISGRRAIGQRRRRLVAGPRRRPSAPPLQAASAPGAAGAVRVVGGTFVHRPDCPLVMGKRLLGVREGEPGLRRCEVCR